MLGKILLRGLRRRCPHCGQGRLFVKRLELYERCAVCGIRFEFKRGDTWGFWILLDRLLIGVPILIFFISLMPPGSKVFYYWAAAIVVVVLGTAQHRYGLCVALDYFSRRRAADPNDQFPELGEN